MFSSFTQTDCFLFQESFIHACAHMHTNYIPHTRNVFRGKVFQVNTLEMERSMLLPELSLSGFLYHEQLQKLLTVFHTKSVHVYRASIGRKTIWSILAWILIWNGNSSKRKLSFLSSIKADPGVIIHTCTF